MVLLIKAVVIIFFSYISYDAFKKRSKHLKNADNEKFNRHVLKALARKETRRAVLYLLIALAAFAAIFIKT